MSRGCAPQRLMQSASSVIAVAAVYNVGFDIADEEEGAPRGRISRYALVDDYHRVMRDRLGLLAEFLNREVGSPVESRIYVDTGPLVERAVGQRAGIGWFGKNTNLIVPEHGSWAFLGELITSLVLEPDVALRKSCGHCNACVAACPTGALLSPYNLDARRCISFLTIELRGWIPRDLRSSTRHWVFGCDVCQEVCPINTRSRPTSSTFFGRLPTIKANPSLLWLLELSELEYEERLRNSVLGRAKRQGLRRNAAVALGNSGDRSAIASLSRILLEDEDEIVRGHAAWALGRLGGAEAVKALLKARLSEPTTETKAEIEHALDMV